MKRILTLMMIAGLMAACSTEEETIGETANDTSLTAKGTPGSTINPGQPVNECFSNLTASYSNTGTFDYPVWTFTANIPAGVGALKGFSVQLQIQGTDCEDITVGYGNIITYTGGTFYNVSSNPPFVTKPQSQLPACYRWRLYITGPGDAKNSSCSQVTKWYDMPLA